MIKWIKKNQEWISKLVVCMCVLGVLVTSLGLTYKGNISMVSNTTTKKSYIKNVGQDNKTKFDPETQIVQRFCLDEHGISSIRIKCKVKEENTKIINVSIRDVVKNKEIESITVNTKENVKDGYLIIPFHIEETDYEQTVIDVVVSGELKNVSFYRATCDDEAVFEFVSDYESQAEKLVFKVVSAKGNNGFLKKYFLAIALFALGVVMVTMCSLLFIKKIKLEYVFLMFIVGFGIVYSFALPPLSVPDEPDHFATSYYQSNVLLGVEDEKDAIIQMRNCDGTKKLFISPTVDSYRYVSHNAFSKAKDTKVEKTYSYGNSIPTMTFVSHLPQTLGITLARILKLGFVDVVYAGRIFNILFYGLLLFFTIRIIPQGKNLMIAISGFPMMLQQVSSYSYDAFVCALSFFFIAYILRLVYASEKVRKRDVVALTVTSILLAPCKLIYVMVCFLVLIIPKEKFSRKRTNIIAKTLVLGSAMVATLVHNMSAVATSASGDNYIEWAGEKGYTISYLLHHIGRAIKVFINTIHEKGDFYVDSLIGGDLSWFTVNIPSVLTICSVIIVFVALFEERKIKIKTWHKVVFVVISIIVMGLAMVSMWIGWTPLSYNHIEGVQGRYFLPILPLLLICIMIEGKPKGKWYSELVVVGCLVVNYLVIMNVFDIVAMS